MKLKTLLILLSPSLAFVPFTNQMISKSLKNLPCYSAKVQNDFKLSVHIDPTFGFHAEQASTNWMELFHGQIDWISENFKYFILPVGFIYSGRTYEYYIPQIVLPTTYLKNNTTSMDEFFYKDGHDIAGYYQSYIKIFFRTINNIVYSEIYMYQYAGWCVTVPILEMWINMPKGSLITFFN